MHAGHEQVCRVARPASWDDHVGMVRLPDGQTLPARKFYELDGDDLRPYASAQVAVAALAEKD